MREKVTEGSGNVFADLGFANSEEMLKKARIVGLINRVLNERSLNQTQAARVLGISQPRVSALRRGRLTVFSFNKLINIVERLGLKVDVTVSQVTASRTSDVNHVDYPGKLRDVLTAATTNPVLFASPIWSGFYRESQSSAECNFMPEAWAIDQIKANQASFYSRDGD